MEWNGMKWNENGIASGSVANGIASGSVANGTASGSVANGIASGSVANGTASGSVAELTPSTKRQTHTRRFSTSKSTRVIGGDLCRTSRIG